MAQKNTLEMEEASDSRKPILTWAGSLASDAGSRWPEPPFAICAACGPSFSVRLDVSWLLKIAPKSDTPNDPPMERKKVEALLATPRSFCSTLFCAISIVVCMRPPMPRPRTAMNRPVSQRVVLTSCIESSHMASAISAPPAIGKILYLPVFVIACPTKSETTMAAAIIGSSRRPELVAEAPWTVCWNRGRKLIAPNIAKPSRKPISEMRVKLRFLNTCSGMIGSATRRSTGMKAAKVTTATATSPRICQEPQAYWLPPQVVMSTSAVMPTPSRPAPSQSMRCSVRYFGRCSRNTSQMKATAPMGRLT